MSRFTEFSSVSIPNKRNPLFNTTEDLCYEVGMEWSNNWIIVPTWFSTNFASLPWFMKVFFDPWDYRWILAAILHDFLFYKAVTLADYKYANQIFLEAMIVCGTPRYLACIFYLWVEIWKFQYYIKGKYFFKKDLNS